MSIKFDANSLLNPLKYTADFVVDSDAPLDEDGANPLPPLLARKVEDIEQICIRGPRFTLSDLPAFIDAAKNLNGPGLNDRKFLLEKLLTLMARSPDDSVFSAKLQQVVIGILYKDLPHPPSGYLALPSTNAPANPSLSKGVKYAFRSADGSNYNVLNPSFGKAGMPYARSVPSTGAIPPSFLPDPGLVFDTLLKRDQFVEHPGGISSLFFAFADLVIHSIFNTNPRDWTINDSSSYLDLSPLYGSSETQVDSVRRKDGTGRLWEDVFADSRLLFMPPAAGALLVLFCRNHNFVAERILEINELRTYADPATLDEKKRAAQDEEIFQRTRLVNTAFFMQVILGDYVGAILGLTRDGLAWRLDPLEPMRELTHEFSPLGEGNVVAMEFNLLYRWHATTSLQDTQWTDELFAKLFKGQDPSQVTVDEFKKAVVGFVMGYPTDVRQWTFSDLKRGADGRYTDADLAKILQDATEAPASAFKARGIPEALRVVEILGIMQARSWGTCSLNEFRSFIGLRPYKDFKEWNPDPKIYTAAESLYHDIDNLELHVGLQAEETKVPMPGAGLCPGYTISRAILADAVCLTRGDRFLTVDFTPFNLTSWGYQDCMYDKHDGSFGGILPKLLFRTLPGCYAPRSAHAYFPFMVPKTMRGFLEKLPGAKVDDYTWTRPGVGVGAEAVVVSTLQVTSAPVAEPESEAAGRLAWAAHGVKPDREAVRRVLHGDGAVEKWGATFARIARELVASKSVEHVGSKARYLNVVRNVVNLVPVYCIANEMVGLPLKTEANPRGVFREQELLDMFADVANYVYLNGSSAHDFVLRERVSKTAAVVIGLVKAHLANLGSGSLLGFADHLVGWVVGENEHDKAFLTSLLAAGTEGGEDALAVGLFVEVVATAALYSRALAEIVDYYLDGERRARIVALFADKAQPDAKWSACVREALYGPAAVNGAGSNGLSKQPKGIDSGLVETAFFEKTAYQVLRVIFSLDGLKRAPGPSGQLNSFSESGRGGEEKLYLDVKGKVTPWPVSMIVQYNALAQS